MKVETEILIQLANSFGYISNSQKKQLLKFAKEYGDDTQMIEFRLEDIPVKETKPILSKKEQAILNEKIARNSYEKKVKSYNLGFKAGCLTLIVLILLITIGIIIS